MAETTFTGVSPRSLGDLLKGYGVIAVVGAKIPDARFWWNEGFHLVADMPTSSQRPLEQAFQELPLWAEEVAKAFQRTRKNKKKGVDAEDSALKTGSGHDSFGPLIAEFAAAVSRPQPLLSAEDWQDESERNTEPHPWFPGYGQEASGNYFDQLAKAASAARRATSDLEWSLTANETAKIQSTLKKGYLFFPEPTKRYATGIAYWEQEKAAVTAWCFLLALRGALSLRGSLRRLRWRRSGYPAFPFVFEGGGISEVHLPTWAKDHPRTLQEFLIQIREFHAPLSLGTYSATAPEFRAAIRQKGPAVGFDVFHRFVLERRRPGQKKDQHLPQAIPRGLTRVGLVHDAVDLRGMIAPLGESGWIDQFLLAVRRDNADERAYAFERRRSVDDAIHRAVDESTRDSYLGVLQATAALNRDVLMPGKLRRVFEKQNRTPRPAPPLPVEAWEKALSNGWTESAEWRLARALSSIIGAAAAGGAVGPILEHLLPVQFQWETQNWAAAKNAVAPVGWHDRTPIKNFQALLWRRWLLSEGLQRLPFAGARTAPLHDVFRLLRGELDLDEIHKLTLLFAHLGWQSARRVEFNTAAGELLPVPPAYAALRLWLDLGISPANGLRAPRDGEVPRLLSLGGARQVELAVSRALARLRIRGLPRLSPTPIGRAVATAQPRLTAAEAERMAVAVLVPISHGDTLLLARRLLVVTIDKEIPA